MPREVITQKDVERIKRQAAESLQMRAQLGSVAGVGTEELPITADKYKDRLVSYIPADVVAAYMGLRALTASLRNPEPVYPILFALMLVVTVPWQRKISKISKWRQVWIGTGAFVVWAVSLGEPFTTARLGAWFEPAYVSMLLVAYTFLIPLMKAD